MKQDRWWNREASDCLAFVSLALVVLAFIIVCCGLQP